MNMEKASFPSRPISSLTIRSVKLMQASDPGGWMVMVVPLVKSESMNFRGSYADLIGFERVKPSAWGGIF